MERNANYILVGAFISLVSLAFVMFVVWLIGSYDTKVNDRYTIVFPGAVSGLNQGGKVHYLGVEVGRVTNIRLDPARPDLIRVDIEIDERTPVRSKTRAELKPQGITGLSFIELNTPEEATEPPIRARGEPYPVIKGSGSHLEKLFQSLPEITNKLIGISERIDQVLSDQNVEKVGKILTHAESVSRKLDNHTGPTFDNLNATLDKYRRTAAGANELIDNTNTVVQTLENDLATARQAIDNVLSFTRRLDNLTARNERSIDQFLGMGLTNISVLAKDARTVTDNAEKLTGRLAERPSRLLFQPQYKGLVIPKE